MSDQSVVGEMRREASVMGRRMFFASVKASILRWAPWLGLAGLHIDRYARPALVGWQGSLHWFGRLVGFVRLDGTIQWWP